MTIMSLIVPTAGVLAQGDHYANTGKIYTVIACVSVILIVIAIFLFYLERRIKKLELSASLDEIGNY